MIGSGLELRGLAGEWAISQHKNHEVGKKLLRNLEAGLSQILRVRVTN